MDRELLYREKMKQLFGDADSSLFTADPEFAEILNKFVFGEVYNHGKLTDKERILITLCALTAGGIFKNFKRYIKAGLNTGLSPEDIKEALYQCAPYTGFPKALKAIHKALSATELIILGSPFVPLYKILIARVVKTGS